MGPLAAVAAAADRVARARLALDMETIGLRQSIVAADAQGAGTRNAIARAASRGLSRRLVLAALAAHDLEEDARAALADLPVVFGNDGIRVRVRLWLIPPLDFPASELDAAADAVVGSLAAAGIVLTDAEDPRHPVRDDLATGMHFVTIARASRLKKTTARAREERP